MKREGKKVVPSLSNLIEKFSQEDVIAVMEKEYQAAPARLIPTSLIDDTSFIKDIVIPKDVVSSLAAGLKEKGFYNPLIVRSKGDRFELILGRKRFFGAKKAGILSLPCVVRDAEDEEVLLMLLADTRDNRSANVLEMAVVCKQLSSLFGYTQQTLADLSHLSRSQITNILRILSLPDPIKKDITLGKLSYGHARALVSLEGEKLETAYKIINEKKLSVRESERLAHALINNEPYLENSEPIISFSGLISSSEREKSITLNFNSKEDKERFIDSFKCK